MTPNYLKFTLVAAFMLLLPSRVFASKCIVIGDSQSAYSLEQSDNNKSNNHKTTGLTSTLAQGLKAMGYETHFYALKGSGAKDWITSPADNRNTLIGRKNEGDSQLIPFQTNDKNPLKFETSRDKTLVDQVFEHHANDDIDCFLIQLGDNDIFRDRAPYYMSELVKHILGKDKAPRLCAVLAPTFKEEKKNDEYPFITNSKKLTYITQVRHFLQKNNLLEDCSLVSTLSPEVEDKLKVLPRGFTSDGLFYNHAGGEVWAQSILQSQPFASRR